MKHHEDPQGRTFPHPWHLLRGWRDTPFATRPALGFERGDSKPPARSKFLPLSALSLPESKVSAQNKHSPYISESRIPPRNVSAGLFSLILC